METTETTLAPVRPEADRLGDACAACGERLVGEHCHGCGERRARPEDDSLWHFFQEQFHEVTSADGKMWRTLRALFVPGKLTEEYFAGRRGLYLRPVRLFLVVNVLFFVVLGIAGGQAFRGHVGLYRGNPAFAERLDRASAEVGVATEAYDAAFIQQADTLSKTLIAVFIPLFAVLLGIALLPLRPALVRLVVFSTHFVAVLMAVTVLLAGGLLVVSSIMRIWGWDGLQNFDPIFVPLLLIALVGYLVVGIRRVYGAPWWGASLAGVLVGVLGVAVVLQLYQVVLFYATLWTVDVPA